MPDAERPGAVFLIPLAGNGTAEHFAHTLRLARHVADTRPTVAVLERSDGAIGDAGPLRVIVQRETARPLRRVVELVALARRLHGEGHRTFYVRTSQVAALTIRAALIGTGARVWFWHCGMREPRALRSMTLREALASELPLRLALRTGRLVTGTPLVAKHYAAREGARLARAAIVPNDVDVAAYHPAEGDERAALRARLGWPPDRPVVLGVHRLSPVRRSGLYLGTLADRLAAAAPGAVLALAGTGPEEGAVRAALAAAGHLPGRVVMHSAVPSAAVVDLYRAADVFVMASWQEGFPRVLIEAMAAGLPFAATDAGGTREVVGRALQDAVVPREDPAALADAVVALLADPALAERRSALGADRVRRYDTPLVAGRLHALFDDPAWSGR